ncbi:60S ribosomal protein L15 [Ophidiomyces ophidiicola]|nr:60S ribosomal protein L15 [Ophidiomyces ophidiicola]
MERAEKRDGFAKKFEAEVREDEKRLLEMLDAEQKKIQAEEEQFKSRFESLFRSALAPPSVMPKDIETSEENPSMQNVGLEEQPLYRMTKDTLERSHKLLEMFNKLNDHASSIKPLPDLSERWEKDHAEVQRLIKVGSEVSAEEIERLIMYENPENPLRNSISQWRRKRKRGVEDDENLKNMLDLGKAGGEGGSRGGGRRGWGLVAHQVQKGFEALVKALPEEEMQEERERCAEAHLRLPDAWYGRFPHNVQRLREYRSDNDNQGRQPKYDKMGALKYVEELQRKKQSDVMRFLLRVRCWELRQLNVIHRASRPSRPDKARRLGYKAKQGYVIYRVRVRRGGRKRPVPKGATYGKPTNHGVNQLKYQRSLKSTAEERVGKRCANLRVLNSYWINQDSTYKYYEVILVDPQHKAIRRDPRINWIVNPVHKVSLIFDASSKRNTYSDTFSTANAVASPQPARNPVVSTRATATTRPPPADGRPGSATTLSVSGDTDKRDALRLFFVASVDWGFCGGLCRSFNTPSLPQNTVSYITGLFLSADMIWRLDEMIRNENTIIIADDNMIRIKYVFEQCKAVADNKSNSIHKFSYLFHRFPPND